MLNKGGKGDGKGRGRSPGEGGGKGNGSRGNSPQPKNKFIWNGNCWYCNEPSHKRETCEKLKKIPADNNGKEPTEDMGAYEKARKAWQDARKKEREDRKDKPHLKSMIKDENGEDGTNTEHEDSSDDDALFCAMRVKPVHESRPTSTANHFAALTSMENDVEDHPRKHHCYCGPYVSEQSNVCILL